MPSEITETDFFNRLGLKGNPFSSLILERDHVYKDLINLEVDGFSEIFSTYTSLLNQYRSNGDIRGHIILIFGFAKSGKTSFIKALKDWFIEQDNSFGINHRPIISVDCTAPLMGDDYQSNRLFKIYYKTINEMIKMGIHVDRLDPNLLNNPVQSINIQVEIIFDSLQIEPRPIVILENFSDSQPLSQTIRLLGFLEQSFAALGGIVIITSSDSNVENDFKSLNSSRQFLDDCLRLSQINKDDATKITEERIAKCKFDNNDLPVKYELMSVSEMVDLFFSINPPMVTLGILSSRLGKAFQRIYSEISKSPLSSGSTVSFSMKHMEA